MFRIETFLIRNKRRESQMNRTKKRTFIIGKRQFVASSLAAALLMGSMLGTGAAYASEAGSAPVAATSGLNQAAADLIQQRLNSLISETSMLADKDTTSITEDLQRGMNLVQSSSLGSELYSKLASSLEQEMDVRLGAKLSREELERAKSEGKAQLFSAIQRPGFQPASIRTVFPSEQIITNNLNSLLERTAFFANIELAELQRQVDQGITILQASGVKSSELLEFLISNLNQELDNAVASSGSTQDVLKKAKDTGAQSIHSALTTSGYKQVSASSKIDLAAVGAKRLETIIEDTAFVSDRSATDVESDLSRGYTLVQASGWTASELQEKLVSLLNQDIELAAAGSTYSRSEIEQVKQAASAQIRSLLFQTGITRNKSAAAVDFQQIIDRRLNSLISDISFLSGNDRNAIEDAVNKGSSLAQASGLTKKELLDRLTDLVSQDMDVAAAQQDQPAGKLMEWKSQARIQIAAKL
jgi:hypothetical protein